MFKISFFPNYTIINLDVATFAYHHRYSGIFNIAKI